MNETNKQTDKEKEKETKKKQRRKNKKDKALKINGKRRKLKVRKKIILR